MPVARSLALLSALFAAGACAQTYPQKPVRIIVPYVAGGDTDIGARIVAPKLTEALGQQFIVENRPGAGSLIGTEAMLRSPADGYTLAMGTISSLAVLPVTKSNVSYDPRKDFAPIALLTRVPYVLVVHPTLPARSTMMHARDVAAAILFVYMIMVALYDSYMYPFVVLFSIPVAIIGAVSSTRPSRSSTTSSGGRISGRSAAISAGSVESASRNVTRGCRGPEPATKGER